MDTEIVDYTSEKYSLGAFIQARVLNSFIFSMDSMPSSSEHSIWEIGLTNADNENVTLLPEGMFIRSIDTSLYDLILAARKQDCVVLEALEALKIGKIPPNAVIPI